VREFLNNILAFIGAESLTDLEFAALPIDSAAYNQSTYDALSGVLVSRESVSTMQDRLVGYFKGKGLDVAVAQTGRSNIFLGAVL